jgi:hypothetical protein
MNTHSEIKWLPEPQDKDYPSAASFLNLLYDDATVKILIKKLKKVHTSQFKAKDIFRSSGMSLLGISNSHVENDRKKITEGKELSPVLLVRDDKFRKVIIADGYHRMCAVYSFSEDALIPCKIV